MKKWLLIRKTLKMIGFDTEQAKEQEVEVVSIDEDITVNYTGTEGEFSGNVATGSVTTENVGYDQEDMNDDDASTIGAIFINGGDLTLNTISGATNVLLTVVSEDGVDISGSEFVEYESSNEEKLTLDGEGHFTTLNGVGGQVTITVTSIDNSNVFSKIKVIMPTL